MIACSQLVDRPMRVTARPVNKFWIDHNRKLGHRDTIVIFNSIGNMYPEDLNPDTKGTMNRLNGKVTAKFMAASASVIVGISAMQPAAAQEISIPDELNNLLDQHGATTDIWNSGAQLPVNIPDIPLDSSSDILNQLTGEANKAINSVPEVQVPALPAVPEVPATPQIGGYNAGEVIGRTIAEINAYRAQNGLPMVNQTPAAQASAQGYADFMLGQNIGNFSGTPNGYHHDPTCNCWENLLWGYNNPDAMYHPFNYWRNSPGHNANLLAHGPTSIGVGVAHDAATGHFFAVMRMF